MESPLDHLSLAPQLFTLYKRFPAVLNKGGTALTEPVVSECPCFGLDGTAVRPSVSSKPLGSVFQGKLLGGPSSDPLKHRH